MQDGWKRGVLSQGGAITRKGSGNVKAPKKRRGRKPKVKVDHDLGRGEDPDDGFPDWMGAG